jgi:hypothetical protein
LFSKFDAKPIEGRGATALAKRRPRPAAHVANGNRRAASARHHIHPDLALGGYRSSKVGIRQRSVVLTQGFSVFVYVMLREAKLALSQAKGNLTATATQVPRLHMRHGEMAKRRPWGLLFAARRLALARSGADCCYSSVGGGTSTVTRVAWKTSPSSSATTLPFALT